MDYKLGDTQADRDAAYDAKLEAAKRAVAVRAWELYEQLPFLTDSQLLQFCEVVVRSDDAELQHMVRLVCADIVERKAKQMVQL